MKSAEQLAFPLRVLEQIADHDKRARRSSTSCSPASRPATCACPTAASTSSSGSASGRRVGDDEVIPRVTPYVADFDENSRFAAIESASASQDPAQIAAAADRRAAPSRGRVRPDQAHDRRGARAHEGAARRPREAGRRRAHRPARRRLPRRRRSRRRRKWMPSARRPRCSPTSRCSRSLDEKERADPRRARRPAGARRRQDAVRLRRPRRLDGRGQARRGPAVGQDQDRRDGSCSSSLEPGEFFGEISLLDPGARTATATVHEGRRGDHRRPRRPRRAAAPAPAGRR